MKVFIPIAFLVVAVMAGCSSTEEAPVSEAPSEAPVSQIEVEKLEIDLAAKLVRLPGEGWISAQAFWEIYYNQPQKLPGEIDFELVQALEAATRPEGGAAAEDNGYPSQQPVDMGEGTLDPA